MLAQYPKEINPAAMAPWPKLALPPPYLPWRKYWELAGGGILNQQSGVDTDAAVVVDGCVGVREVTNVTLSSVCRMYETK